MQKTIQKRTLKTRARLIDASQAVVKKAGYEALRVEEVVQSAGVAKGTFFAHFHDKDALMEILIGERLDDCLELVQANEPPASVADLIRALTPVHEFMTSERYVFDLIIRYSGAAAIAEIGPIAHCFERYYRIVSKWMETADFRKDIAADLLAEGVQAFAIQAMSLKFCALHEAENVSDRLETYLNAWLTPSA